MPKPLEDFVPRTHYTLMDDRGVPYCTVIVPLKDNAGEYRVTSEPGFSAQNEAIRKAEAAGYSVIDWFDATTMIVEASDD